MHRILLADNYAVTIQFTAARSACPSSPYELTPCLWEAKTWSQRSTLRAGTLWLAQSPKKHQQTAKQAKEPATHLETTFLTMINLQRYTWLADGSQVHQTGVQT